MPGHFAQAGPVLGRLVQAGPVPVHFAPAGPFFGDFAQAGSLPAHFGRATPVGAFSWAEPERVVPVPARTSKLGIA